MARLLADRRAVWAAVAAVCALAGALASVLGARALAKDDAREARTSFGLAAAAAGSTLRLSLQREQDLTVAAGTFFASEPQARAASFERWAGWSGAHQHIAGLERLALVSLLPRRQQGALAGVLPAVAQSPAAPAGPTAATGVAAGGGSGAAHAAPGAQALTVEGKPYECRTVGELGASRSTHAESDCRLTQTLLSSRATGLSRYRSTTFAGEPALALDTPVYRGNALPLSAAGRRAAFVGWLHALLAPGRMAHQALAGRPGEAVRLRYRAGATPLLFASGSPSAGAQSSVVQLPGGWSARVLGAPANGGVFANGDALALLLLGLLASLLAAALILLLGLGRVSISIGAGLRRRSTAAAGEADAETGAAGTAAQTGAAAGAPESLYDPLTGLPSRELTLDRGACMIARVGRQSGMLTGALLIDVDWFEDINDKLGQAAGDQLLRVVAERLQAVARADDSVGRLEGDRFVALVEAQARGVKLESLAGRMIEALREPVEIDGFGPSLHMTASIGVAFGRYSRIEDLLTDAQVALDAAKAAGKNRSTLFNANLRSVIEDRGVLDSELNAALQDDQFFLLYEPICDVSTHRVVGVEALIRWRHPERGVLAAEEFLSAAEETALIVPIGRWALEEACTRAAAWSAGGERVGVSVKVSPTQIDRDGFVSDVRRALHQSGVEPSSLTLQVPESAAIGDIDKAARRLAEVKQLGVRIAVEEFGGGYSHRSDLQRLPLDFLKVDRDSIAAADDEDYRSWLLEAVVLFARDLSLGVIVAGVHSGEQLASLERIGCTMVQGPLVGEPVAVEGVAGVLGRELAPAAVAAGTGPPVGASVGTGPPVGTGSLVGASVGTGPAAEASVGTRLPAGTAVELGPPAGTGPAAGAGPPGDTSDPATASAGLAPAGPPPAGAGAAVALAESEPESSAADAPAADAPRTAGPAADASEPVVLIDRPAADEFD